MEIEKLIKHMRKEAQDYRAGRTLGRAFADAENVLDEAATALEQLQAENDRLQAEMEKEEAARKKQADILYELRGQKYEQTTAIDQLRAENERLRRERDAAVESWRGFCSQCAWKNHQYLADGKMDDMCRTCRDNAKCNWKWRGPKEE